MMVQIYGSAVAFGFDEPPRKTFDVSAEERERIFQDVCTFVDGE